MAPRTYPDIASEFGMTEDEVRHTCNTALSKLFAELSDRAEIISLVTEADCTPKDYLRSPELQALYTRIMSVPEADFLS